MKLKNIALALNLLLSAGALQAKTALVVISHGAPMGTVWNQSIIDVEKELQKTDIPGVSYKRVALMEYARPNISDVVKDCEAQGCDTIFALPLFIAPSSHSSEDVPNILDLQYNPEVRAALAEEKTGIVHTRAHVVIGPELYFGDVIEKALLARVRSMSKDPKNEALILLVHGDPYRTGYWKELLDRNCRMISDSIGITYTDSKQIAMGQNFIDDLRPVISKAAKARHRVLVQAIYLTTSIGEIAHAMGLDSDPKSHLF